MVRDEVSRIDEGRPQKFLISDLDVMNYRILFGLITAVKVQTCLSDEKPLL